MEGLVDLVVDPSSASWQWCYYQWCYHTDSSLTNWSSQCSRSKWWGTVVIFILRGGYPLSSLPRATATQPLLAPIWNAGPVCCSQSHQANWLYKKHQNNWDEVPSRKAGVVVQGWLTRAVNSAVKVQVKLHNLGPSSTSEHGDQAHQHEELEGLGIRAIWDRRYVFLSILGFYGLMLLAMWGFNSNNNTIRNYHHCSCRLTPWIKLRWHWHCCRVNVSPK